MRGVVCTGDSTLELAEVNDPTPALERDATKTIIASGRTVVGSTKNPPFNADYSSYLLTAQSSAAQVVGLANASSDLINLVKQAHEFGITSRGKRLAALLIGEDGEPLPRGEVGELVFASPSLTSGYWNKPAETAATLTPAGLRSGDVGFVDADGWVFLIDRKKDMISASGYKVWPRDVEDVLYMHPAVREAAVVGVPDGYRGETVKAVVSLKEGYDVQPAELTAFCRERMAAYKYPRLVEIVDDLPETPTGKIMRRMLRD